MSAFRFVRRFRRPAGPKPSRVTFSAPRVEALEDRATPASLSLIPQLPFTSQFTFGGEVVRTGDFNGDGFLDYVAANSGSQPQLEIGLSNGLDPFGRMSFSRQTALSVPDGGLANLSIAVGDFVGTGPTSSGPDGFADIAVGTAGDSLYVFQSNGDGSFLPAAKTTLTPSFSFFGEVTGLAAGDLNKDGLTDLFVARSDQSGTTPREYTVFLTKATGGFDVVQKSAASGFGSLRDPAIADVDGDGFQDVVAYDGGAFPSPAITPTVAVFWGKGDGTFDAPAKVGAQTSVSAVATGDFNGDGVGDLAVGYSDKPQVDVFYQSRQSPRTFPGLNTTSITLTGNFSPRTADLAAGDLDFDGRADLVVGLGFFGKTAVYLGAAKNTFTFAPGSPFNTQASNGVVVADFDGNQLPDFFEVGWPENKNQLFLNKTVVGGEVLLSDDTDPDQDPTTIGTTFYKQPFTVSVTVTKFLQTPTGTVDFFANGSLLQSVTLAPDTVTGQATASFTRDDLDASKYTIVAKYSGDANYAPNNTTSIQHLVQPAVTTTAVSATANPLVFGQPVTFTVGVTASPTISGNPDGQIAFFDNGDLIGSAFLDPTGMASFTVTNFTLGDHPIEVSYIGVRNFAPSAANPLSVTVSKSQTATGLNAVPRAGTFGDPVALTATVSIVAPGVGAPIGDVTFFNGAAKVGIGPIAANGKATFTVTGLNVGTYDFSAKYAGNDNVGASNSAVVRVTVAPTVSSMTLTADPADNRLGGVVTLRGNVSDAIGRPVNVGTVSFQGTGPDGKALTIASAPVVNGVATSTVTGLGLGDAAFTATFSGTDSITGSTAAPTTVTTKRATPAFTLASDAGGTSVALSKDVTFTATFAPPSGLTAFPTGTVTLRDNGTALTTLPLVNGAAQFTTRLPLGAHTIAADYTGDATYLNSSFNTSISVFRPVETFAVAAAAPGGDAVAIVNPDGSLNKTLFAFGPDDATGVRVATGDLNGDGVTDTAVGSGPGVKARVRVLDGKTSAPIFEIFPFDEFTGGVFVSVGDTNGDLRPDLIVTPDQGGGPRVRIFSGNSFGQIADYFGIDDPNFRGGVRTSPGDINGDGVGDLIVAAGFGGGPRVSVWDGRGFAAEGVQPRRLLNDFFAFDPGLRNGVYVAGGDVDGDGFADLVIGAGPGGGPRVVAVSGRNLFDSRGVSQVLLTNFFAGDPASRDGVPVAVRFVDGDNRGDIVTGTATGGNTATVYAGGALRPTGTPPALLSYDAFQDGSNPLGGIFVG